MITYINYFPIDTEYIELTQDQIQLGHRTGWGLGEWEEEVKEVVRSRESMVVMSSTVS